MHSWLDHFLRHLWTTFSICESYSALRISKPKWLRKILLTYSWTRPALFNLASPSDANSLAKEFEYHNSTNLPSCPIMWLLNSGSTGIIVGQPAKLVRNISPYLKVQERSGRRQIVSPIIHKRKKIVKKPYHRTLMLVNKLVTLCYYVHPVNKWRNPKCNGVLPPGSMGFSLIGETLQLIIRSYSLDEGQESNCEWWAPVSLEWEAKPLNLDKTPLHWGSLLLFTWWA